MCVYIYIYIHIHTYTCQCECMQEKVIVSKEQSKCRATARQGSGFRLRGLEKCRVA